MSLAAARTAADERRAAVLQGNDPMIERALKKARSACFGESGHVTFLQAAEACIASRATPTQNSVAAAQWPSTLRRYAYPILGELPIDRIEVAHVRAVLDPIWRLRTVTAQRVQQRMARVFDYAAAMGWRPRKENPAAWRGNLDQLLPSPRSIAPVEPHAALPWTQAPKFMSQLRRRPASAARALEFLILTGMRVAPVIGARWAEINFESATWVIPAVRVKGDAERPYRLRVPLSSGALAVLEAARAQQHDEFIFRGGGGKGLSSGAFDALLERMRKAGELGAATAHGFRSSFRDWAADNGQDRDLAELSLGHQIAGASERAYWRSDLLERRRILMEAWSAFLDGSESESAV